MAGAFGGREYESRNHRLRPLSAGEAAALGAEMAATDPWKRLGFTAEGLAGALAPRERTAPESPVTFGLEGSDSALAGAISVRPVWLRGPYLALLFVRAESQSRGTGLAALEWMEAEAGKAGANSLWTAVSAFNDRAFAFYKRFGFEEVALLPDLVTPGEDERLLRKRLRIAKD